MALAFNVVISQTSSPLGFNSSSSSSSQKKTSQTSFPCYLSRPRKRIFHGNFSSLAAKTDSVVCDVELAEIKEDLDNGFSPASTSSNNAWSEFAKNVSGEWDGFGADFTKEGTPIELPESVVPEAYREWEVKVFDWQTQCPSLADQEEPVFNYKTIKLLPTVGYEADAATRYSVEEKSVGGVNNRASAFAYHSSGCYVSVWRVEDEGGHELLELEHCLVNPQDRESRVRVIQAVRVENRKLVLKGVTVFVEQWYGPFRNGDQLGGCSIRDSAFAYTAALKASDVVGVWRGVNAIATFGGSQDTFQHLGDDRVRKSVRDDGDDNITLLPKQLWCSLKESKDGDTCCEVGWLSNPGRAIASKCTFSGFAVLKDTFQHLGDDRVRKSVRDEGDDNITLLPKQLWCSLKESKDGDTCCEVGWLSNPGRAIASKCTFSGFAVLKDTFQHLGDDRVRKSVRDEGDDNITLLPKQLWCSLKESKDGDTCCEVGWLSNPGRAIASKCTFSGFAVLKEISVASETLEGI